MVLFDVLCLGPQQTRTDRHRLAGTIYVDGAPAKRLVVVVHRISLVVLAVTFSDATTGVWEVSGNPEMDERSLLVLALDNTGNYNAEVADYISQVTGN